MDIISTSSKKQKVVDNDECEIITNMPEDIIGHILSFLSTKDAVRTSVLSKRWKLLWTSITCLSIVGGYLSYMRKGRRQRFIEFLDKVLKNLSSKRIHSFSLCLSITLGKYENPGDHLLDWICSALNLGVEKLCIEYISNKLYSFSISFFQITSLVHLDLNMSCNFIVPTSNCFQNLKILKVKQIRFVGEEVSYLEEMVLNFPVLELFDGQFVKWWNVKNVIIKAPLLEDFSLVFPRCDCNKLLSPTINVFSLHLKNFHYSGKLVEDIIFSNPLSIDYASIEVRQKLQIHLNQEEMSRNGEKASKLLKQFQRVKFLKLGLYTIQALANGHDYISALPVFQSLIRLELDLSDVLPSQQILLDLLHKSPNLEKLGFLSELTTLDSNLLMSKNLPECFLFCLKAVKIGIFDWNANTLSLTKYILENTKVLEHLTILTPKAMKRQIRKELQHSNDSSAASIEVEKTTQMKLYSYRSSFQYP